MDGVEQGDRFLRLVRLQSGRSGAAGCRDRAPAAPATWPAPPAPDSRRTRAGRRRAAARSLRPVRSWRRRSGSRRPGSRRAQPRGVRDGDADGVERVAGSVMASLYRKSDGTASLLPPLWLMTDERMAKTCGRALARLPGARGRLPALRARRKSRGAVSRGSRRGGGAGWCCCAPATSALARAVGGRRHTRSRRGRARDQTRLRMCLIEAGRRAAPTCCSFRRSFPMSIRAAALGPAAGLAFARVRRYR